MHTMKTKSKFFMAFIIYKQLSFWTKHFPKIDSIISDNYKKKSEVGISVGYINNNNERIIIQKL